MQAKSQHTGLPVRVAFGGPRLTRPNGFGFGRRISQDDSRMDVCEESKQARLSAETDPREEYGEEVDEIYELPDLLDVDLR